MVGYASYLLFHTVVGKDHVNQCWWCSGLCPFSSIVLAFTGSCHFAFLSSLLRRPIWAGKLLPRGLFRCSRENAAEVTGEHHRPQFWSRAVAGRACAVGNQRRRANPIWLLIPMFTSPDLMPNDRHRSCSPPICELFLLPPSSPSVHTQASGQARLSKSLCQLPLSFR
jgi:hypothetical protein